jgi:hypothetical protein
MILGMGFYSTGASSKRQLRPTADAVLAITGKEINPAKNKRQSGTFVEESFVVRRRNQIGHGFEVLSR